MPRGVSATVKPIIEETALGPQLSTYPTDPVRGQDLVSVIETLYPVDPVQPPGPAIQAVTGPDAFPNSAPVHDWLL